MVIIPPSVALRRDMFVHQFKLPSTDEPRARKSRGNAGDALPGPRGHTKWKCFRKRDLNPSAANSILIDSDFGSSGLGDGDSWGYIKYSSRKMCTRLFLTRAIEFNLHFWTFFGVQIRFGPGFSRTFIFYNHVSPPSWAEGGLEHRMQQLITSIEFGEPGWSVSNFSPLADLALDFGSVCAPL